VDKPADILPLGLYCAHCNAHYTGSEAQVCYVTKVIRTAFLAPDLVEMVLEGRAATELTLAQLTKDLPWD
jgi:hypothetical protein